MKWKRIVEDDEEIQRHNDMPLEKKVKVEGNNTAAELAIVIGRDLEGEAAEEEDEDDGDDEVKRLRELLKDDPKKLNSMDVEDAICYLEVDDIVELALKSGQGKGSDDGDTDVEWVYTCQPDCQGKAFVSLISIAYHIEYTWESAFRLAHENTPHHVFAPLLLYGLESYKKRRGELLKTDDRDVIRKLCAILPSKLLAHILSYKASLPLLKYASERTRKPSTRAQKKAAIQCDICLGKGKHIGPNGRYCSFLTSIPKGLAVGPNCEVVCRRCNRRKYGAPDETCKKCRLDEGKAVPSPKPGKAVPYFSKFGSAL